MDIDELVVNIKDFQENFLKVVNKDYGQEEDLDKDLKFLIESMNPIFLTANIDIKMIRLAMTRPIFNHSWRSLEVRKYS